MKATSLFGGVQLFQIIITIIRSKFVAVLIGPEGMGVVGLLRSTIDIMGRLTNMGIGVSAVKNVASANSNNDPKNIATTVTVLKRLVILTGMFGLILTFLSAPVLSDLAFGNKDFTFAFRWLSISLLLKQLSVGQMVLLQGLRKLRYLANANIMGSIAGILITIPIYYYLGINGIVPVILTTSLFTLLISSYFSKKVKIEKIKVSIADTFEESKGMIHMGLMISLSGLLTMLSAYLIKIYINYSGNLADVGFYGAGFAIVSTYTGLIFRAMGKDYYPRLTEIATDPVKIKTIVNQQAEISILILAPILTVFMIFINMVIVILYSTKFLPVTDLVHWAALGIFFKAGIWAMGFILLARGDTKWYFWNQLVSTIYFLGLNILGYTYFGLTGLGIAFLITNMISFIQNLILTNYLYKFKYTKRFYLLFFLMFGIALVSFILSFLVNGIVLYLIGGLLVLSSSIISYRELDKRMNIKSVIVSIKKRKLR